MNKLFQIDITSFPETGEWGAAICHVPSNTIKGVKSGGVSFRKMMRAVLDIVIEREKQDRLFSVEEKKLIIDPSKPNGKTIEFPTVNRID